MGGGGGRLGHTGHTGADGTGWLFESKDGELVMEPVDIATGVCPFRVAAQGVELLPQPIAMRGSPCPPGTVLWTDARVKNGSEEFAHVQVKTLPHVGDLTVVQPF